MYEKLVLSNLDKEVVNSAFLGTIDAVLSMLREEAPDPYYKLTPSMITLHEEIACKKYYDKNIYDSIDIAMQQNCMRFVYLPDKDKSMYIKFSTESKISQGNNTFTTFFIGRSVKNDDTATIKFISDMIYVKIRSILDSRYGISIGDLILHIAHSNPADSTFINSVIAIIDMFVCYYKAMDAILNLKYADCDKIVDDIDAFIINKSDSMELVERLCYDYAITENHDPNDYNDLCKECFNKLKTRREE